MHAPPGLISRISIIIPVYNGEIFLERAIESALHQTVPPAEIVITDDASTDGTSAIIARYQSYPWIRVFRLPDRVPAPVAWNQAIRYSTSSYFTILAHDDLLDPTFIEEAENTITTAPNMGLIVTGYRIIDESDQVTSNRPIEQPRLIGKTRFVDFFDELVAGRGMYFCDTGCIVSRNAFDQIQGFDERFQGGVYDFDFFLRLAAAAPVFGLSATLADYRLHSANMSAGLQQDDRGDGDVLFSKMTEYEKFSLEQKRMLVRNISNFQFQHYSRAVTAGDLNTREISLRRERIAQRLARWAESGSPCAQFVLRKPVGFRARLAWFLGASPAGVALLRLLTRIIVR